MSIGNQTRQCWIFGLLEACVNMHNANVVASKLFPYFSHVANYSTCYNRRILVFLSCDVNLSIVEACS